MCWTCQDGDCFEIWARKSHYKSGSKEGQKGGQNRGCLRGVQVGSLLGNLKRQDKHEWQWVSLQNSCELRG